jgi:flagellar basal body-associated protein FliL
MQKKKIVLLIILILFVAVLLGVGIYYFFYILHGAITGPGVHSAQKVAPKKLHSPNSSTPADQSKIINKNYPEIITGVIKFLDTKDFFKTTLTTDSGTEYVLWPAQPESVYESFGAKNSGRIQVNGKPLEGGKLSWALMKPI